MQFYLFYHAGFAMFLSIIAALFLRNDQSAPERNFALFAGFYCVLVVGLFRNWRFAWTFAFAPPLIVTVYMGLYFAVAAYSFMTHEERVQDSPGTVLAVGLACLLTLPPAISLLRISIVHRKGFPAEDQEDFS